jgi:membrane-bound ClpP family serine protease
VLSGKRHTEAPLIIAGIVLLLLGLLLGVGILYTIGIILIIVGAVLWVVGSTGRAVGGHRHYY